MVKGKTMKVAVALTLVSILAVLTYHHSQIFGPFFKDKKFLRTVGFTVEPDEEITNAGLNGGGSKQVKNGVSGFQQADDENRYTDDLEEDDEREGEEDDDSDDESEERNADEDDDINATDKKKGDSSEELDEEENSEDEEDESEDESKDDSEDDSDDDSEEEEEDDEDGTIQPKKQFALPKRRRLPKALIIGFSKCGTTALTTFLTLHPDIVSPIKEVKFFNYQFSKGLEWYRLQMPPSTERQVTIEKTSSYILSPIVLQRIHDYDPNVKVIIIIRNPIRRLQSQYVFNFQKAPPNAQIPAFQNWCKGDARDGRILHFISYAKYIAQAYAEFPENQVLILAEEDFEQRPLYVMNQVESFLNLKPAFTKDMFYYNKTKGYYCFNTDSEFFPKVWKMVNVNTRTGCVGEDVGVHYPDINKDFLKELVQYIRPHNKELFQLIGKRIRWEYFE